MSTTKQLLIIALMIGIIFILSTLTYYIRNSHAMMLYEDQYMICNFEHECQIINIDDYINNDNATKLQYNFDNNLDTFNLVD